MESTCLDNNYDLVQETFEAGLATFEQEGIKSLTAMKDQLDAAKHPQAKVIKDRHSNVIRR